MELRTVEIVVEITNVALLVLLLISLALGAKARKHPWLGRVVNSLIFIQVLMLLAITAVLAFANLRGG